MQIPSGSVCLLVIHPVKKWGEQWNSEDIRKNDSGPLLSWGTNTNCKDNDCYDEIFLEENFLNIHRKI